MNLKEASSPQSYTIAKQLFMEYAAELEIDLSFQNFNKELDNIQKQYSRPEGILFILFDQQGFPIGCFGIRALENSICELKRMFLKKRVRGTGLGKLMMTKAIESAKELGYKKMRLDTLASMHPAVSLYRKIGFYEIDPYCFNPVKEAKYFEIDL